MFSPRASWPVLPVWLDCSFQLDLGLQLRPTGMRKSAAKCGMILIFSGRLVFELTRHSAKCEENKTYSGDERGDMYLLLSKSACVHNHCVRKNLASNNTVAQFELNSLKCEILSHKSKSFLNLNIINLVLLHSWRKY